jgi:hypothetical protein
MQNAKHTPPRPLGCPSNVATDTKLYDYLQRRVDVAVAACESEDKGYIIADRPDVGKTTRQSQ